MRGSPFTVGAVVCALLLLLANAAFAQQASIAGAVIDESKLSMPGVTITVTNVETGVQSLAVTDTKGEYRVPRLAPGKYKVQSELTGFAMTVVEGIELLVGQTATVSLTMKVAQLNETVLVSGEAALVDVASSQVGGNVDRRQMEEIPLQGRNWLELSKYVKGITANTIGNTPGVSDEHFQLNLDGQQITQKVAGSGFGQPRFSREAIAEFQVVTNLFDITQGRSLGTQVQAISRSGTNKNSGSFYGNFRDDELNAADPISKTVLPYRNRQIGGSFGGPIVRDRMHYFISYEDEREPKTQFTVLTALPGQSFSNDSNTTQKSLLGRVDLQASGSDRFSVRVSQWNWDNPFVGNGHPSNASQQGKDATNLLGSWTRTIGTGMVQEVKVGYNNFSWANLPLAGLEDTIEYRFPGLTIGKPYNYPQLFYQDNIESRYDLNWHAGSHDVKIGGEFIYVSNTGDWFIQDKGIMVFTSLPADIAARIPESGALDPSTWNFTGLDPIAQRFDRNYHATGDWQVDVPRPTWALWFGDNWRANSQLTINYGVRWDVDLGATSAPNIIENQILIDNGLYSGDYGYKGNIRDLKNVAPRAGFAWNVGGTNDFVIRGGSGLYFTTPVSNVTYSPQIYSQMITATFPNDGKPGFINDPTRGVSTYEQAAAAAPAQSPRTISGEFRNPYTWQSSIGFQKQLGAVTGIEADLTHYNGYRDSRTMDPNLFYDPATGYNRNVTLGRPNPAYGVVSHFISEGRSDQTMLSMGLNRRYRNQFQAGATYALMLTMHDDGSVSYGGASGNNPFDNLDGEYATSTSFQRHTVRAWSVVQLPWGFSTSLSYAFGSGTRYAANIGTTPYGKGGTNRLNLSASGGPSPAITVPVGVLDRWNGPAVVNSGDVIPRNALDGMPISKVDLRVEKSIVLVGTLKAQLIAEVFNLFNRANYTNFSTQLSPTNAATTALFGQPTGADVSRQGQLAFRLSF